MTDSLPFNEINLLGKTYKVSDTDDIYYATKDAARRLACPKGWTQEKYDNFVAGMEERRLAKRRAFFQELGKDWNVNEP